MNERELAYEINAVSWTWMELYKWTLSRSHVFDKIWLLYEYFIWGSEHGEEDQFEKDAKLNSLTSASDNNRLNNSNALNDDDVFATAFVIMVAGYDTTGRKLHELYHYFSILHLIVKAI